MLEWPHCKQFSLNSDCTDYKHLLLFNSLLLVYLSKYCIYPRCSYCCNKCYLVLSSCTCGVLFFSVLHHGSRGTLFNFTMYCVYDRNDNKTYLTWSDLNSLPSSTHVHKWKVSTSVVSWRCYYLVITQRATLKSNMQSLVVGGAKHILKVCISGSVIYK